MLLNCGVGEHSWESLGLQGDPTSQSLRKPVLNIHWKDWCWSWSSNTLATWCEELTHLKRPWCWEDWRWEDKGTTEDEVVAWHHWLDGHKFESALGVDNGQGSLVFFSPWGCKESDMTEMNWTELNTVKGFGIVNKAEVDVFLELSCFFNDPMDVCNLISGSSAFSKSSLYIWNFSVHILLKPGWKNFEHYFFRMWHECNCGVVWTFFGIVFFGDWNALS